MMINVRFVWFLESNGLFPIYSVDYDKVDNSVPF
jgi:hypothetical protein